MATVGQPTTYVKTEPGEDSYAQHPGQGFGQRPDMAQQSFNQYGGMGGQGAGMDPNDIAGFPNSYATGSATLTDDLLRETLPQHPPQQMNQPGMAGNQEQGFGGGMNDMNMAGFTQYGGAQDIDTRNVNGYSNTPEGDPIHSPFAHSYNQSQFRQMQHQYATSIQSPISYSGSPLTGSDFDAARLSQSIQPKASVARSPLPTKSNTIMNIADPGTGFGVPIRRTTHQGHHERSPSQQWVPTGTPDYRGASFQQPPMNPQMAEMMMKQGTSMPVKMRDISEDLTPQEAKRKRRRDSHNQVERRRRDNINERIQYLQKLVPDHRLEDEKVKKILQQSAAEADSKTGTSQGNQATSCLAGAGARRATSGGTGNITQGLPMEDKDKGPNKGDILHGAVNWTSDLMWMLKVKLDQQDELQNYIAQIGGHFPIEITDEERRMESELMDALEKIKGDMEVRPPSYSRADGTNLRVPRFTDYAGNPVRPESNSPTGEDMADVSQSPENNGVDVANAQFWQDPDDIRSPSAPMTFKEDDEFMDLTQ